MKKLNLEKASETTTQNFVDEDQSYDGEQI
jgi:hypothetical protein